MHTDSTHVSWLTLEQYALGELPPETKVRVDQALEVSPELRSCLARIQSDRARTLPPLPVAAPPRWGLPPLLRPALAIGAVLLLVISGRRLLPAHHDTEGLGGIKGGDVAIELVR